MSVFTGVVCYLGMIACFAFPGMPAKLFSTTQEDTPHSIAGIVREQPGSFKTAKILCEDLVY